MMMIFLLYFFYKFPTASKFFFVLVSFAKLDSQKTEEGYVTNFQR